MTAVQFDFLTSSFWENLKQDAKETWKSAAKITNNNEKLRGKKKKSGFKMFSLKLISDLKNIDVDPLQVALYLFHLLTADEQSYWDHDRVIGLQCLFSRLDNILA